MSCACGGIIADAVLFSHGATKIAENNRNNPVISIRPATAEDIPQMCGLLTDLFSIESDFDPDAAKQSSGLGLLLDDRNALVLVADSGGEVIGMATVQTIVSTAEGGRVGLVEDVIVDERFRCQGIGSRLLDRIAAWSRDRGLKRLQLLADIKNHRALNFYESCGWASSRLVCRRKML